jgi:glycosyltransferase involved in cell wall biosynthesis
MAKDRSPRLTIVTLTLDTGGTERHIALIAPRLAESGFDVSIICLGRTGVEAEAMRTRGVRVTGPIFGAHSFVRSSHGRAIAISSGGTVLTWELLARRPAIVHVFLPLPYLVGAPLAALARVPHVVMSRRSQNLYQAKRPKLAKLEHRLHRRMDLILANSRRVHDELIGEGADPARTGLIYNGLDLSRYSGAFDRDAARRKLGLAPDALVLAIVANLICYKGHADLIAALGSIGPCLSPGWRLLVVGRDDGLGQALKAQAETAGIAANILWLGERRDVPDLLRLADIGLNTSHEEGFSNAVIEGLAAGLPMIVTDVGGNAEAVADGESGLVVPLRSPIALAEALTRLVADPAVRERMGVRARERAVRHFSLESCVSHYRAAYGALLAGAPMPAAIDPRQMRLASTVGAG